jgi:hypothetical protein
MKLKYLGVKGTWREVANSARTTIHKEAGEGNPSSSWIRRMLLCEHSPIRQIIVKWKWYSLPYWTSTHFVRHWLGITHWVRTQRTDRTGVDRTDIGQGAFVEHEVEANAQAIINISRKRLCFQASKETREAWELFLDSIKDKEPELYSVCVCDCVYRGWCYEYLSCGFYKTNEYKDRLNKYRENINVKY